MNIWNRISKSLALFAILLTFASSAFAQGRVSAYTITTAPSGYADISSSGQLLISGAPVCRYYGSFAVGSMPFKFVYDNQTIAAGTPFYWTGGCLGLGSYGVSSSPGALGVSSYPNQIVFAGGYWCLGDGPQTAYIYQQTTGSAPNRVYTLQIMNYHGRCGGAGANRGYNSSYINSCQIKLYEATGVIDLLYLKHGSTASPCGTYYSFNVGLNGSTSPSFSSLQVESVTGNHPTKDYRLTPPAPPTEFSLQSKSLNYGGLAIGQSLTLTTTLTVLGPSSLVVSSVSLAGSTDFTLLNSLAPNTTISYPGSYTFQIKYAPTNTGNGIATLTVVTNAKDSATQIVSLNGSGLAPLVQYTFAPYNGVAYPYNTLFHHVALRFGDTASETFYVANPGQAPLAFNGLTLFGLQASMYQITHSPQNPLPVGKMDSITLRFSPFLEGRPDAALAISTNAFNQANDTVSLWGTGKLAHLVVTPQEGVTATGTTNGSLLFDSVAIGDSVCKTLALHNTGTDTLYIPRQQVTYGDYDFHFYPLMKPDTMIAPDQTKLVNICFTPVQAGLRVANIRFYTTIPKTYPDQRDTSQFFVQVNGTGVPYGKLALSGTATVSSIVTVQTCFMDTIWNTGSADLTVNSVKLSGANASDFTLTPPTLPVIIPKGGSLPVSLCYKPAARGLSTASLDVTGMTSGRPQAQSLAINGTGQIGCMSAAPNPVPFGSAKYPGITLAKAAGDDTTVTVTNCGDVAMTFTAAATPAANYTVTPATSAMIPANGTATFKVHFKADTIGAVNGSLKITASEATVPAQTVALGGVGGGVVVAASGTPSNTRVNQTSTFKIHLVNNGNVAWVPGTASFTVGASDYSSTTNVPSIAPAGTADVTVTFAPTVGGNRPGTMTFAGQDVAPLVGMPYSFSGIAADAGVAEIIAKDGFAIGASYPNPASKTANLVVTMPRDAKATVALVRIDGSQVASVFEGSLSEGQHTLTFDVSNIASGTYFYSFESGTTRLVRQMVIAK